MDRDREVNEQLATASWKVLRFWESEVLLKPDDVVLSIIQRVSPSRSEKYQIVEVTRVEMQRRASVTRASQRTFDRTDPLN